MTRVIFVKTVHVRFRTRDTGIEKTTIHFTMESVGNVRYVLKSTALSPVDRRNNIVANKK